MNSIDARLAAISAEVERRRMIQAEPVDDLSRSMSGLGRELSHMDSLEKSALLAEFNRADPLEGTTGLDLSMEDLERFIADYGEVR